MLEGGGRSIAELSGWTEDGPLLPLGGCRLQVGDGVWLGLTVLWEDGALLVGGGGGVSSSCLGSATSGRP